MSKIHVIVNPNIKERAKIANAVLENGGYCPCKVTKDQNTRCPCKDFRDQVKNKQPGYCHCRLYKAELLEGENNE